MASESLVAKGDHNEKPKDEGKEEGIQGMHDNRPEF
jgi:hypothetical protein